MRPRYASDEEEEEERMEEIPVRKRSKELKLITVADENGRVLMKLAVKNTQDLLEAWTNDFQAEHGSLHLLRGTQLKGTDEIFDEMILLASHQAPQGQAQKIPNLQTYVIKWPLLWEIAITYMLQYPGVKNLAWDDVLDSYFDRNGEEWWSQTNKDERKPWKAKFRDAFKDRYRGGVWEEKVKEAREERVGIPDPGSKSRSKK